jgi:pyruvate dehydrogenase E2 component (dihydrolipoamide acetyltransferase)
MAIKVTMPRLSDTMTEGTVATWLKKSRRKINEGDILLKLKPTKQQWSLNLSMKELLYIGIPEGETAPVDSLAS